MIILAESLDFFIRDVEAVVGGLKVDDGFGKSITERLGCCLAKGL